MRTSVGRACALALAAYLKRALSPDIVVTSHWPDPDKRLPARAVSVIPVGRRRRDDASTLWQARRSNITPTEIEIQWEFGGVIQPLQLDLWDRSEDGRDDIIAQLDDALYAGLAETLQEPNGPQTIVSDPVRDGVLVPMLGRFEGGVCDCWFEEPAIDDTPDAIQRGEYRATYLGEGRTAFTVTRTSPRLLDAEIKIQTTLEPPGDVPTAVIPFATVTLTPDDSTTPPSVTVTHGTSTT